MEAIQALQREVALVENATGWQTTSYHRTWDCCSSWLRRCPSSPRLEAHVHWIPRFVMQWVFLDTYV